MDVDGESVMLGIWVSKILNLRFILPFSIKLIVIDLHCHIHIVRAAPGLFLPCNNKGPVHSI